MLVSIFQEGGTGYLAAVLGIVVVADTGVPVHDQRND
jgi:hypothetical protein